MKSSLRVTILLFVFFSLGMNILLPVFDRRGFVEAGSSSGTIIGDSVVWENNYAKLSVYPHTSHDIITQTQYANLTWKYPDNTIDIAFRFNNTLPGEKHVWIWRNISHFVQVSDYGNITTNYTICNILNYTLLNNTPDSVDCGDISSLHYVSGCYLSRPPPTLENITVNVTIGYDSFYWLNDEHTNATFNYTYYGVTGYHIEQRYWFDWDDMTDSFSHTIYNDKHYYYITNVPVKQNKTYQVKWQYNQPANTQGKWDLLAKLSSDTIATAFSSGRYIMIDPWWNAAWDYMQTITLSHTNIDADLVNFPVLVRIPDATGDKCDGGNSLRFTAGSNSGGTDNVTEYNYDIEKWTDGADRLVWVNVTRVYGASNTVFNMYYGNAAASAGEAETGTWNSGYKVVLHMNGTTTIQDSTSNNHDGTADSDANTGGQIGDCQSFTKANSDDINMGDHNDFSFGDASADTPFTWSCWVKPVYTYESTTRYYPLFSKFSTNNWEYQFYYVTDSDTAIRRVDVVIADESVDKYQKAHTTLFLSQTAYNYVTLTYSANELASGLHFYINGTEVSRTCTNMTGYVAMENKAASLYVGYLSPDYYGGLMDECRISNIQRNASWIKAEYHNQWGTAGFLTFGSELSAPSTEPLNSAPYPSNGATGVLFTISRLNITVTHLNGYDMNITFKTNASGVWQTAQDTNTSVNNGTYRCLNTTWVNKSNTKYWWNVSTNDGMGGWDNDTYYFTTGNIAPTLESESPGNTSTGVSLTPTASVLAGDSDGDTVDVSWYYNTSSTQYASYLTGWSKQGLKKSLAGSNGNEQGWMAGCYNSYDGKIYIYYQDLPNGTTQSNTIEYWSFTLANANTPASWSGGTFYTSSHAWDDGHIEPHGLVYETTAMAQARNNYATYPAQHWRMYYCGIHTGEASGYYDVGFVMMNVSAMTTPIYYGPVYNNTAVPLDGFADPKAVKFNDKVYMFLVRYPDYDAEYFAYSTNGITGWTNLPSTNWTTGNGNNAIGTTSVLGGGILLQGYSSLAYGDGNNYVGNWTDNGDRNIEYNTYPLFSSGAAGSYDRCLLWNTVIVDKNSSGNLAGAGTYYMYYIGRNSTPTPDTFGICLATTSTVTQQSLGDEEEWILFGVNNSVDLSSGSVTLRQDADFADAYSTKYWWKVCIDDGTDNVSKVYHFTTGDGEAGAVWQSLCTGYLVGGNATVSFREIFSNYLTGGNATVSYQSLFSGYEKGGNVSVILLNVSSSFPVNNSQHVLTGIGNLSVIIESDGEWNISLYDNTTHTLQAYANGSVSSAVVQYCDVSTALYFNFNKDYTWYVNATDGSGTWLNVTYYFTTFNGSGFLYLDNDTRGGDGNMSPGVWVDYPYVYFTNESNDNIYLNKYKIENLSLIYVDDVALPSLSYSDYVSNVVSGNHYVYVMFSFFNGVYTEYKIYAFNKTTLIYLQEQAAGGAEGDCIVSSNGSKDLLHIVASDRIWGFEFDGSSFDYDGYILNGATKISAIDNYVVVINYTTDDLYLYNYSSESYTLLDTYPGTYNDVTTDGLYFYGVSETSLDIFSINSTDDLVLEYSYIDSGMSVTTIGDTSFIGSSDGDLLSYVFEGGEFIEHQSESMNNNSGRVYVIDGSLNDQPYGKYLVIAGEEGGIHLYGYELLRVAPPVIDLTIAGDPNKDSVDRDGTIRYVNQSYNNQTFVNITALISVPDYRTIGRYFRTLDDKILVATGNLSDGDVDAYFYPGYGYFDADESNHTFLASKYPCTYTGVYSQISAWIAFCGHNTAKVAYAIYSDVGGEPGSLLGFTEYKTPGESSSASYEPDVNHIWYTLNISYDADGNPVDYITLNQGTDYWLVVATYDNGGAIQDVYWVLGDALGDTSYVRNARYNLSADMNFSNATGLVWTTDWTEDTHYLCIYAIANTTYNDNIQTVDITSATVQFYNGFWEEHSMTNYAGEYWTVNLMGLTDDSFWHTFNITAVDELGDEVVYYHYRMLYQGWDAGWTTENIQFKTGVPAVHESDHLGYSNSNVSTDLYNSSYVLYLYEHFYDDTPSVFGDGEHSERVLPHEQGVDGGANDTGRWLNEIPDDELQQRYCYDFSGGFWDANISIQDTITINNVYLHWWVGLSGHTYDWDMDAIDFGRSNTTYDPTWLDMIGGDYHMENFPTNSSTKETSTISGKDINTNDISERLICLYYNISSRLENSVFDGASIYQFFIGHSDNQSAYEMDYSSAIYNNRSYLSYIIFNIPPAVLSGTDTRDSDSDGLSDYYELNVSFTHPFLQDTDGDGVNDDDDDYPNDYTKQYAIWNGIFSGYLTGGNNTVPWNNILSGYLSGGNETVEWGILFFGYLSGGTTVAFTTLLSGWMTGGNSSIYSSLFSGYLSGGNDSVDWNVLFSGDLTGGNDSVVWSSLFTGYLTGGNASSSWSSLFSGYDAGGNNTVAYQQLFSGYLSGGNGTVEWDNLFTGYLTGGNNSVPWSSLFSGYLTGGNDTVSYKSFFSGYATGGNASNEWNQMFSGWLTGGNGVVAWESLLTGYLSGGNNTVGMNTLFTGWMTGGNETATMNNIFSGYLSGGNETVEWQTLFSGYLKGGNLSGLNWRTFIDGYTTGGNSTVLYHSLFTGYSAGGNDTVSMNNLFSGYLTGGNDTVSYQLLFSGYLIGGNESGGDWNILFSGYLLGGNNTVQFNTLFFGYLSGGNSTVSWTPLFSGYLTGGNLEGYNWRSLLSGYLTGGNATVQYNNLFSGYLTGGNESVSLDSLFTGYLTGGNNTALYQELFTGYLRGGNGTMAWSNLLSGYLSGWNDSVDWNVLFSGDLTGGNDTVVWQALFNGYLTGGDMSGQNWYGFIDGYLSGGNETVQFNNLFTGCMTGGNNTVVWNNLFSGHLSGGNGTTEWNSIFSGYIMGGNTTAYQLLFTGYENGGNASITWNNLFTGHLTGGNTSTNRSWVTLFTGWMMGGDITAEPPGNNAPVAYNDYYSMNQNNILTITAPGVLTNDTDADLDPLVASKQTNPIHGSISFYSNGSFIYTPTSGYYGTDSFTYKAHDGYAYSNIATVTITINQTLLFEGWVTGGNITFGIQIINIYPVNESSIKTIQPTVCFTLFNSTGVSNYTVYTGNSTVNTTSFLFNDSYVGNVTGHGEYYNATTYYVPYYWEVCVYDNGNWLNETYHFTVVHEVGGVSGRSPLASIGVLALFVIMIAGMVAFIYLKRRKEYG